MPSFPKNARAVGGFYLDYSHGGYRYVTLGDKVYLASDVADLILANRDHVQREYPGTPKAAETLAILSFIDTVSEL